MNEINELITKALKKPYFTNQDRKWLRIAVTPYNWDVKTMGVEMFALEGSPIKGFVIVDYGRKQVYAFDGRMKRLR